ncbi:hypothetical protein LTR53_000397 [Teratosphaeriaceae sp. CCFEE 6253]|nr:hypothetical protein LTR53_000397 [Teratosphaeriaceae sp. CCFEE 6253]
MPDVSHFPGFDDQRRDQRRRRRSQDCTAIGVKAHLDQPRLRRVSQEEDTVRWCTTLWAVPMVPASRPLHILEAGAESGAVAETQVDHHDAVISRLFPGRDVATLVSLPREELINLALTLPAPATSPLSDLESTVSPPPVRVQNSDGADSLEALEQAPDQDPATDEARRHRDRVQGISDDVNGLSLSVDKQSSYVGVSSITAALKVIFKTAPAARSFIVQSYTETALPSRANTPPPQAHHFGPDYLPSADVGHALIESYFSRVHALMPMVDEDQFWHTYLYGERKDSPWLALLNMVLALGSLAGSTCDNLEHIQYFQQARKHLDLETFGSGNLLILQALGLLSGYYLHWLNRPNEANSLMGATLRMATALGLHREYADGRSQSCVDILRSGTEIPVEIRRRTWWSLFCLDTWASMTTGRPPLGRVGEAVTVQSPKIPEQMNNAQYLASLRLLPIIHNIAFCKLATKIQDKLALHSLLKPEELYTLDAELVRWHEELPPILQAVPEPSLPKQRTNSRHRPQSVTPSSTTASMRDPFDFSRPPQRDNTPCPELLRTPRAIMHWWYMTLRMLMHRPYLLAVALRRTPFANMTAEERVAVSKCRAIAGEAIKDIAATGREELIAGWNSVWLMYQAAMVPLVSLFSYLSSPAAYADSDSPGRPVFDASTGSDEDAEKWRAQIETAMEYFDSMQRFSVAAKKSKDVVQRLLDASKHVRQYHEAFYLQQQLQHSQQQQQSPPQGFGDVTSSMDVFSMPGVTNHLSYPAPASNLNTLPGPTAWGLSPNGDAAMNSFWDDMMWDTFPEMPDPTSTGLDGQGVEHIDWLPLGGQSVDQTWTDWTFNEQQP